MLKSLLALVGLGFVTYHVASGYRKYVLREAEQRSAHDREEARKDREAAETARRDAAADRQAAEELRRNASNAPGHQNTSAT